MSDLLAAAAAALGVPEEVAMRSAQARAEAEGKSVDEILAAWAGGSPPPDTAPEPEQPAAEPEPSEAPPAEEAPAEEAAAEEPGPAPEPTAPEPPGPADSPRPETIADAPAPVLVGRSDSPGTLLAAIAALFLAGFLGTVVLPVLAAETETSVTLLRSAAAEEGRQVYTQEGCWYCHTQLVRPIVTDAGLGPVTDPGEYGAELPVTVGVVRIGPDLARAGLRAPTSDAVAVESFLRDPGDRAHQSYDYLSPGDLAALAEYVASLR